MNILLCNTFLSLQKKEAARSILSLMPRCKFQLFFQTMKSLQSLGGKKNISHQFY